MDAAEDRCMAITVIQSCSQYNELPLNAKLLTLHSNFF